MGPLPSTGSVHGILHPQTYPDDPCDASIGSRGTSRCGSKSMGVSWYLVWMASTIESGESHGPCTWYTHHHHGCQEAPCHGSGDAVPFDCTHHSMQTKHTITYILVKDIPCLLSVACGSYCVFYFWVSFVYYSCYIWIPAQRSLDRLGSLLYGTFIE